MILVFLTMLIVNLCIGNGYHVNNTTNKCVIPLPEREISHDVIPIPEQKIGRGHTVLCKSAAAKDALQLHINLMLYMLRNQTSPKVSFLIKKEGRALESLPTTLQLHSSKLKFALSKTISLYHDEYFEIVSDISEPASVSKKPNSQIILVKDQFPPITTEVMPITKTSSAASHFQGGILNVISRFVSDCLYFPLRNYFFLPFLEIPVGQLGVLIIIQLLLYFSINH